MTGGNVSLYNQTGDDGDPADAGGRRCSASSTTSTRRTPAGFVAEGQPLYLLGTTRDELSGSEWAHVVHGHLGGLPPAVDLDAEQRLADVLVDAAREGLLDSGARPLRRRPRAGAGGVLPARRRATGVGARVRLSDDLFVALFSESAARALVERARLDGGPLRRPVRRPGIAHALIGVTDGLGPDAVLEVQEGFTVTLSELRAAWSSTLPDALG